MQTSNSSGRIGDPSDEYTQTVREILAPLAVLSLSLQKSATCFVGAMSSLGAFYQRMEEIRTLFQPEDASDNEDDQALGDEEDDQVSDDEDQPHLQQLQDDDDYSWRQPQLQPEDDLDVNQPDVNHVTVIPLPLDEHEEDSEDGEPIAKRAALVCYSDGESGDDEDDDDAETDATTDEGAAADNHGAAEVEVTAAHDVSAFQSFWEQLHQQIDNNEPVTYQGVELGQGGLNRRKLVGMKRRFFNLAVRLEDCVWERLGDIQTDEKLKVMRILDTRLWPKTKEALTNFAVEDVTTFVTHFGSLVELQGCNIEALHSEWTRFKLFWARNMTHLTVNETWEILLKEYQQEFPNFSHLISVLLLIPVSNAVVERGFSTMARVKTDQRNRLQVDTLDHLMRIAVDGPPPSDYSVNDAAKLFFTKERRPNQPGPNRQ